MSAGHPDNDLVKIAFHVVESGGNQITETLWARRQSDGAYVLDNSPFYAFDVSYKDSIRATEDNGILTFSGIIKRSGHSTYRVKMRRGAGHREFLKYWPPLALLGCTYEGASSGRYLYSIDIPRHDAVKKAYDYLVSIEEKGIWDFEEAHYFDPRANLG
ncbi:MAG: DUF4265 domain-containing protein [Rhizomicrobium sp.]